MRSRMTAATLGAVLLVLLTGCAPEAADPTPTPTSAFASEEEAFAAAEETYRAYVDALNQVDLSDPATFEPVYDLTTGEANAGARKTFSRMHADGLVVDGPTVIDLLEPSSSQPGDNSISLDVCLDVSQVTLVDETGTSVVADDRRDVQAMRVTFVPVDGGGVTAIAKIDGRDDGPSCGS